METEPQPQPMPGPPPEAAEALNTPCDPLYDRVRSLLDAVSPYDQARKALDDVFLGPQSSWPDRTDPDTGQPLADPITGAVLKASREEALGEYLNGRIESLRSSYLNGVQKEATEHLSVLDYFFTSNTNSLAKIESLKEEARNVSREKARTHKLTGDRVAYLQNESNGFLFAYVNDEKSQAESEHKARNPINSPEFSIENPDGSLRRKADENFDKTIGDFVGQIEHMMGVEKWRGPGKAAVAAAASRTTRSLWGKPAHWYRGERQHKPSGDRPLVPTKIPGRVADHDATTDRMMFEHARQLKKFVQSFNHPRLSGDLAQQLDAARDGYLTDSVSGLPGIVSRLHDRLATESFSEALSEFLENEVLPLLNK